MIQNLIIIVTGLMFTLSTSLLAQHPWDTDTVDNNKIEEGLSSDYFSVNQEHLNATRYYQFGRSSERNEDGSKVTIRRAMDFETMEFVDLRVSFKNFPQRHKDTLYVKKRLNGKFVHYANDVSTYIFTRTVNYGTVRYYFGQYHHKTDSWSELMYIGPCTDTQYMKNLGFGMKDNYFYYAHAMQDSLIQPDPRYAPKYKSTRYNLERLDLKKFKIDTMFTLHMPKRDMILHFEDELFTPDGKTMVLLEYDDYAYAKYGPNDPPPVAYIVDVETNTYKTIEIPLASYGKCISPDSKYLFVGSFLEGTILKIDLEEAKEVKKIASNKLITDFYIAPSGNYFMVTYSYHKVPRKVVDFRSTEDLSLVTSIQLEVLFGEGATDDRFWEGLYGQPILSSTHIKEGDKKKRHLVLNYLPEYIGPAKPGSAQAIALEKAESIAKAKQYMKDSGGEIANGKFIPKNMKAVGFATDGNVIISGKRYLNDETAATYVAKLSLKGKVIWEIKIPGVEESRSTAGYHFKTQDGGCILFTVYYPKLKSFGSSRITRLNGAGKIIYDYKFIRQPNPENKGVDFAKVVLLPGGSLQLEGLSFVERKQFGQNDWRDLYRPWTGTMSPTGIFTDTTAEQLEPREVSHWR